MTLNFFVKGCIFFQAFGNFPGFDYFRSFFFEEGSTVEESPGSKDTPEPSFGFNDFRIQNMFKEQTSTYGGGGGGERNNPCMNGILGQDCLWKLTLFGLSDQPQDRVKAQFDELHGEMSEVESNGLFSFVGENIKALKLVNAQPSFDRIPTIEQDGKGVLGQTSLWNLASAGKAAVNSPELDVAVEELLIQIRGTNDVPVHDIKKFLGDAIKALDLVQICVRKREGGTFSWFLHFSARHKCGVS